MQTFRASTCVLSLFNYARANVLFLLFLFPVSFRDCLQVHSRKRPAPPLSTVPLHPSVVLQHAHSVLLQISLVSLAIARSPLPSFPAARSLSLSLSHYRSPAASHALAQAELPSAHAQSFANPRALNGDPPPDSRASFHRTLRLPLRLPPRSRLPLPHSLSLPPRLLSLSRSLLPQRVSHRRSHPPSHPLSQSPPLSHRALSRAR